MAFTFLGKILLGYHNARKGLRDHLCHVYYRNLIGQIDGRFKIEYPVEILYPQKVSLGDNSHIRAHTILNGRSNQKRYGLVFGSGTYIKGYCYIDAYGGCIEIEGNVNISQFCLLAGQGGITIGKYVIFGSHCCVLSSNHIFEGLHLPYMLQGDDLTKTVVIESNVWIGAGTIILPGTKIGRNSVIGAGSIVNRDVPSNVLFVNKIKPTHVRELNTQYRRDVSDADRSD